MGVEKSPEKRRQGDDRIIAARGLPRGDHPTLLLPMALDLEISFTTTSSFPLQTIQSTTTVSV